MSSLRIVVPRYGDNVIGGAESLMRQVARFLAGAGWSVEVYTSCARDGTTWANAEPPGVLDDDGVTVRRFPVRWPRNQAVFRELTRVFFRLPPRLRPEQPWIVLQGPYAPGLVDALATAPPVPTLFMPYLYFPTLRGIHDARGPRVLVPAAHDERPLRLTAVSRAIAACDALLYSTDQERTLLERIHPAARDKPNAVGTVGVDPPSDVDPARFRAANGIDSPYLLYGGRRTPGKGVEELLAGFSLLRRRHPDVQLVLTGETGTGDSAHDGVRALGRLDDGARWDAIAGAAAVVVPSTQESLSLLALEAWAVGRPALLNAGSPVLAGQAATSGGALTFRGAADLVDAASSLLDDPDRASALGAAGRQFVTRTYRWSSVQERLGELIEAAGRSRP